MTLWRANPRRSTINNPSASIVIVNYNGRALIGPCLQATLPQADELSAEVILVDNGSSDGSVDLVEREFLTVILVRQVRNEGFAGGTNAGVRIARGDTIVL